MTSDPIVTRDSSEASGTLGVMTVVFTSMISLCVLTMPYWGGFNRNSRR